MIGFCFGDGSFYFNGSLSLSSLGAEQKGGSSTFTGITGDICLIPIAISGTALTYTVTAP